MEKSSSTYSFPLSLLQNIPTFIFGRRMESRAAKEESQEDPTTSFCEYRSLQDKKRLRAGELIELASFGVVEIENIDRLGSGHEFEPMILENPAWCDRCGDIIWCIGNSQLVQCKKCHFTCHASCLRFITLDCQPVAVPTVVEVENREDPIRIDTFKKEELMHLINEFNRSSPDMEMNLFTENQTVKITGFIRVCMNLMRPINVISGTRPPSIYDALKQDTLTENRTLTSFYLPVDTMKALHVDTDMTARDVIITLLRKFKVADSPLKYALYESFVGEDEKVKLRRLSDDEVPLLLSLSWLREGITGRSFLLQENDGADINWNLFALPELKNFIRILDSEEQEYMRQIRAKYALTQESIKQLLESQAPRTPTHDDDDRYY